MALKNFSGLAELVKATWFPAARTVYDAAATRVQRSGEHRIIGPRFTGRWGAHRIDWHLHIPRSTVGRVLGVFTSVGGERDRGDDRQRPYFMVPWDTDP